MPWEDVVNSIEEAKQLSRPMDYDYLDLLRIVLLIYANIHQPY